MMFCRVALMMIKKYYLNNGYSLDCMLRKYQNIDWKDKKGSLRSEIARGFNPQSCKIRIILYNLLFEFNFLLLISKSMG